MEVEWYITEKVLLTIYLCLRSLFNCVFGLSGLIKAETIEQVIEGSYV